MTPMERDDFSHSLGQTMEFYNKSLDKQQFALWVRAMGDKPVTGIKLALLEYTRVGRYAPKPVDILDIMATQRQVSQAHLPPPDAEYTRCPPDIAKAWLWFINMIAKDSKNLDGIFESSSAVDAGTQEKYLHVVNHEAHRLNQPDSIPDEYKLREIWR